MRELPAGTVTFLFTDIEGSTKLLHELGAEGYADSLAGHRRALREAFAAKGALRRAGRLWGAIEAEEERRPIGAWESQREEYAARLTAHPGPELEAGVAEGRQLALDEAVAEALGRVGGRGSAGRADGA